MGSCGTKLPAENEYPQRNTVMTPSHSTSHSNAYHDPIVPHKRKLSKSKGQGGLTSTTFNAQLRQIAKAREREEREREEQQKRIMEQKITPIAAPIHPAKTPKSLSLKSKRILAQHSDQINEDNDEILSKVERQRIEREEIEAMMRDKDAACSLNGSDRFDNEIEMDSISNNTRNIDHEQNGSKLDMDMNINNEYDERELSLPSISDSESNDTD